MMGLLRSRALEWAEALLETTGTFSISFTGFLAELRKVFENSICADDSVEFRIIEAESGWDMKALLEVFLLS